MTTNSNFPPYLDRICASRLREAVKEADKNERENRILMTRKKQEEEHNKRVMLRNAKMYVPKPLRRLLVLTEYNQIALAVDENTLVLAQKGSYSWDEQTCDLITSGLKWFVFGTGYTVDDPYLAVELARQYRALPFEEYSRLVQRVISAQHKTTTKQEDTNWSSEKEAK